jgi:hypothetical protein
MTNAPLITAVIPWGNPLVKKTQQRLASERHSRFRVGGSLNGWEITATPQQFLDLGLAKESGDLSLPLVSRLRQAGFQVQGSRTVHLPGGTGVVEVQIDQTPEVVGRVLGCLEARDGADVVTIYDRVGSGHTRVLGAVRTVQAPVRKEAAQKPVRSRRQAAKESALVNAIRQIWEEKTDEFTRNVPVALDSEDYEAYTVQELVSGLLDQFLTDDQLKQWNSLEAEAQTEIMNQAFPENKIQDTVERMDRSFWDRKRGASTEDLTKRIQQETRVDPLDLGAEDEPVLSRSFQIFDQD